MSKWVVAAALFAAWILLKWVIAMSLYRRLREEHPEIAVGQYAGIPPEDLHRHLPSGRLATIRAFGWAGRLAFWLGVLVIIFA